MQSAIAVRFCNAQSSFGRSLATPLSIALSIQVNLRLLKALPNIVPITLNHSLPLIRILRHTELLQSPSEHLPILLTRKTSNECTHKVELGLLVVDIEGGIENGGSVIVCFERLVLLG